MSSPAFSTQLDLRVATQDDWPSFLDAISRGFYGDGGDHDVDAELRMFEPERFFGFDAGGTWVTTTGAYSRRMTVPGSTVPTAAITGVTVAPTYRRRGLLRAMMEHQLTQIHGAGREPVAALWASEAPIYGRFGYGNAASQYRISGEVSATATRRDLEAASGHIEEWGRDAFQSDGPAIRERVALRPGTFDRDDRWWARILLDSPGHRGGSSSLRFAVHIDDDGVADGYAIYRVGGALTAEGVGGQVTIVEIEAVDAPVRAALFRWVFDLDLVRKFSATLPIDDPLFAQLDDRRALDARLADTLYVRVVRVAEALGARRYEADGDVVIGVTDDLLPENTGSYRVHVEGGSATVEQTDAPADVRLGIRELGSLYLGGVSAVPLRDAGLVEEATAGSVAALDRMLRSSRAPFCPDFF
jgi:predicted acetyltransferase